MAKGIDIPINTLKDVFTSKLWTDKNYNSYGRAFVNERDGDKIPEVLTGNRYRDVLLDSRIDAHSFFTVDSNREMVNYQDSNATVNLYFAVNLAKLYPAVSERATEYAHADVLNLIKTSQFKPTALVTGLESFNEFTALTKSTDNMQPFYLFKIELEIINYKIC